MSEKTIKMKIKIGVALVSLAFLLSPFASTFAIEIPLENLGRTTNIAYVNMHKVFEAFPETEQARIQLNRMIEEKKADITERKEEIAQLKGEIDFLKKQMAAVAPPTGSKEPEAPAPQAPLPSVPGFPAPASAPAPAEPQSAPVPAGSTTQALLEGTTGFPEPAPATYLTLPENSPLSFLFSPPAASTGLPPVEPSTRFSTFSANTPQILPGIPSPAPRLGEKEAALTQKEADLEVYVGDAEAEVRRMEEGKTMTLMARIYEAIQEISTQAGYSVIVDRDNILYGDPVTDITDTIILRLRSPKFKKKSQEITDQ